MRLPPYSAAFLELNFEGVTHQLGYPLVVQSVGFLLFNQVYQVILIGADDEKLKHHIMLPMSYGHNDSHEVPPVG